MDTEHALGLGRELPAGPVMITAKVTTIASRTTTPTAASNDLAR
jgi:hypothetical protein